MASRGNPIINTAGIEIEWSEVPKAAMMYLRDTVDWAQTTDGSVRTHRPRKFGVPNSRMVEYGGEFVSPLLDLSGNKWKEDVSRVVEALYRAGEGVSATTSVHVHINATGIPVFALRNLVRMGCYLEAAMYRLSCAESGVNRGAIHVDYGYSRPITHQGPPVVYCTTSDTYRQIFSVDGLLKAQTNQEFLTALGRYDRWDGGKYHEARYTWLNFVALPQHGSIEFRLFNFTQYHRNIITWAKLCSEFVRASFGKIPEDLPRHPLGSRDIEFGDVVEILHLSDQKLIYHLEELWYQGDYQRGILGLQKGHLGMQVSWRGAASYLKPAIIRDEEVHNFYKYRSDLIKLKRGKVVIPTRR